MPSMPQHPEISVRSPHEDGSKPMMIKSSCEKVKPRHELRFSDSEDVEDDDDEEEEESEVDEIEDNEVDDDLSSLEKGMTLFYRTRKRPVIKIISTDSI